MRERTPASSEEGSGDEGGEQSPVSVLEKGPLMSEDQLDLMARSNQLLTARTSLLAEHNILSDRHAHDMRMHTALVQERMDTEIGLTRQHTECLAARTLAIRDQTEATQAHAHAVEELVKLVEAQTEAIHETEAAARDMAAAFSEAAEAAKESLSVTTEVRMAGLASAIKAVNDALRDLRV